MLRNKVEQLNTAVRTLENELQSYREAVLQRDALLTEARGALLEKEAEIANLKKQTPAGLGGRVTPTLPLISSTSLAG